MVFVFATFRFSDGRTAERAAAQLDNTVESLLLHGYFMALTQDSNGTATLGPAHSRHSDIFSHTYRWASLPHFSLASDVRTHRF